MSNPDQGDIRKYPVSLRCAAEAVYGHRITAAGELFAQPAAISTQRWRDASRCRFVPIV